MAIIENIEEARKRQERELKIRNNPLSLYPETLDSLLAIEFPPTRWIVDGLIPSEGITIISATPGSFKTWLLLDIAIKVTQSQPLFDRYPTIQTGVLVVDEESGARMLNERFKQLKAPSGLPITYLSRAGYKVTQEYIDSIISVCLSNNIGLIVFDSLVRLHKGDENTSRDMSDLFDLFKQLADNGLSVLIAHHNRKGMPGSYNAGNDMRGSSDILAAIDCHIAMNRIRGGDTVEVRQTKNRYIKEIRPFRLNFRENAGYSEFTFAEELLTKKDTEDELKYLILEHLATNTNPTQKELKEQLAATGTDIKTAKLRTLLNELQLAEKVSFEPGLKNAVHYKLTDENLSASKRISIYD